MVEVAGRPILGYILRWLAEQGIAQVAINLHYRPERIVDYVGDGRQFGLAVTYSHERELLGSAGTLRSLAGFVAPPGSPAEPFVAVYGDTLATLSLRPLVELHRCARSTITMTVMEHPNPTEAGIVYLVERRGWHGGEAGRVTRLLEKPAPAEVFSTIANAGVFVMDPDAIGPLPPGDPRDIARDLIPAILSAGHTLAAWRVPQGTPLWDVGTFPSLRRAEQEWPAVWEARSRGP